jgi:PAS domain S-box-containing protein
MPTAHTVATIDGIMVAVDCGFLDLVGMSEKEVIGASYRSFTHPDDLERSATMLASLVDR